MDARPGRGGEGGAAGPAAARGGLNEAEVLLPMANAVLWCLEFIAYGIEDGANALPCDREPKPARGAFSAAAASAERT